MTTNSVYFHSAPSNLSRTGCIVTTFDQSPSAIELLSNISSYISVAFQERGVETDGPITVSGTLRLLV